MRPLTLLVDTDGNSVGDLAARLVGTITLDCSDFCGVAPVAPGSLSLRRLDAASVRGTGTVLVRYASVPQ